jgi:hypothetical protein
MQALPPQRIRRFFLQASGLGCFSASYHNAYLQQKNSRRALKNIHHFHSEAYSEGTQSKNL